MRPSLILTKSQASILPKTFFLDIPQDMMDAIDKCKNDAEAKEVGIEWAIKQAKELIKSGAPVLHFYTMGSAEPVRRVVSKVF